MRTTPGVRLEYDQLNLWPPLHLVSNKSFIIREMAPVVLESTMCVVPVAALEAKITLI